MGGWDHSAHAAAEEPLSPPCLLRAVFECSQAPKPGVDWIICFPLMIPQHLPSAGLPLPLPRVVMTESLTTQFGGESGAGTPTRPPLEAVCGSLPSGRPRALAFILPEGLPETRVPGSEPSSCFWEARPPALPGPSHHPTGRPPLRAPSWQHDFCPAVRPSPLPSPVLAGLLSRSPQ